MGSLATMLPSCGFFSLQVLDVKIVDNKPTGEIVVHDGEFYVSAKVDQRYIPELMKRRWGRHSIIQVKSPSGLYDELFIVSILLLFCNTIFVYVQLM